ncbi:hypothetical protein I533_07830 [Alteromonas mediterranea MED64]|uniref:sulfotransferase family 2 domain-containing protein n=1 Tax=Alteromonas mediterranea TaxID=314275 RepID=UPI000355559C|nr:sulfotransferase family 2 domain-containing protein [Alteromonas mediterranea]AGP81542.1 hypothetical protein I533_07830 [Alteromonas mediterranea MED64]MBR9783472.1 sulfotransferase family protein [Gammaproteobacteria bacterium]
MISHKHRCIFIHIPKCAGTSIEYALGHFDNHEGRAGQDHRSVRMICQPGPSLKDLSNLDNTKDYIRRIRENFRSHPNPENGIMPNERQYSDYFKFTIVRNPLDRAYSWYKNAMRDPIHQKNYRIDPTLNFTDFIFKFAGKGFLRPQTYWLKDYNGNIVMDYTGKFENLKEDYRFIADKIGIENSELPHKIESKKSESYSSIDDKAINFINEFYAEDFEKFHYTKN